MRKRWVYAVGGALCAAGVAVGVPGTAVAAEPVSYEATLVPVAVNRVTGNGVAWVTVNGTSADVKLQVNGLLDGAPHAQHIHIDALGQCPTDADAREHNGNLSLTVADGAPKYGGIGTSLTVEGDTTPMAALHVGSFPSAGSYTYERTIELDQTVVDNLAGGTAVLVVHGIDYNGNGAYDDVLGASELDAALPAEATNPALCGSFLPMQMAGVPAGAADTGGGAMAADAVSDEIGLGAIAVGTLALGAGLALYRRRGHGVS